MTTEQIGAIFTGLVLLFTSLYNIYLANQAKKDLAKVVTDVKETKSLVNGQHGVTLEKLAGVREELALVSGRKSDDTKATNARADSDEHNLANKTLDIK